MPEATKEPEKIPIFILPLNTCPINYCTDNNTAEKQIIHQALLKYGIVALRKTDSTDEDGENQRRQKHSNLPRSFAVSSQRLAQLQSSTRERQREMNGVTLFLTSRKTPISARDVLHPVTGKQAFESASVLYKLYCESVKCQCGSATTDSDQQVEPTAPHRRNLCITCEKSIKRHAKVRCALCFRQIHTACLGKEEKVTKTAKGNVWYCDWCICACGSEKHFEAGRETPEFDWKKLQEKSSDLVEKIGIESEDYAALEAAYWELLEDEVDNKLAYCSENLILEGEGAGCRGEKAASQVSRLEECFQKEMDSKREQNPSNQPGMQSTSESNASKQPEMHLNRKSKASNQPEIPPEKHFTSESLQKQTLTCSTNAQSIFSTTSWSLNSTLGYSFHFNLEGSPKQWYSIAPSLCSSFSKHLNPESKHSYQPNMLNPFKLPSEFTVTCGLQHPGDVVVIHPLAWHSSFALGALLSKSCLHSKLMWLSYAIERYQAAPKEFTIDTLTNALFEAHSQATEGTCVEIRDAIDKIIAVYLQLANVDHCVEYCTGRNCSEGEQSEGRRESAGTGNCNCKFFPAFAQKCSNCEAFVEHLAFECKCHERFFCFGCVKTGGENECFGALVLRMSKAIFDCIKQ